MTTIHRISTAAMLILSLAAASAPAASARPVGPDVGIAANGQSSAAVRANPNEQTVTGATANPPPAAVYSRQDKSMVPATSPSTTAPRTAKVSSPPPVLRLQAPGNGFDWGDAGIGAAAGVALSMIGLGGALAVSQQRNRRARRTTALTG